VDRGSGGKKNKVLELPMEGGKISNWKGGTPEKAHANRKKNGELRHCKERSILARKKITTRDCL